MAPSAITPPPIATTTTKQPTKPTPLEAISCGPALTVPTYPSFTTHRAASLSHMAAAFRVFARKDYTEGMSGHISLRDPEFPHLFWTNPLGRHFGLLKASDMVLLDYNGRIVGGNTSRPANAAGFLIHAAVHRAREDVVAACHAHSKFGKAWSSFAKPLEMINQDVCYFYGEAQGVYEDFGGVVLSAEEGEKLAAALGEKGKGLILRNHGLLTVGNTVDEAAYLFTLMERSCEAQLLVEAATKQGLEKVLVPEQSARFTFEMASDPDALYWEFQPDREWEVECSGNVFDDHTGEIENFVKEVVET